jgi:hypothetical protein
MEDQLAARLVVSSGALIIVAEVIAVETGPRTCVGQKDLMR